MRKKPLFKVGDTVEDWNHISFIITKIETFAGAYVYYREGTDFCVFEGDLKLVEVKKP